ncbi:hypothetical protein AXK56_01110 [Tsukamurella pulmonis]|uniref:Uncharacterized protein n=1 Tax=Tsukamurella pulmonis TaxID=47312 RepID=A0A1H1EY91_9ACTN|nr:DUF692 domain-containing protein [Tsukamurella pulmonis]KXO92478.1 hypothetical protein AXK56_01110 [Tsukamurella pulmonis]SDQ93633.1 hypothetical protein SAMN04489765_2415 [Tsukamurella pulmonis]SUP20345.1 Protein of uncharacterised function (DUF692) [Tsukamurella pulmonis]
MSTAPRTVPALGPLGLGWRREIAGVIADLRPGFCEVIAESVPLRRGRARLDPLQRDLRERGVPLIPHGVALSLGGVDELDPARVHRLAACAEAFGAPLVSEHVAFVRASGIEAGHLLPVPRTREALDVLVRNITRLQQSLPVPVAVENIAAFLCWPEDEFSEAQFLTELLARTGALLVLDVANVYANARNRGLDPQRELARLPADRIAYGHVAGGSEVGGRYHDTHTDPVSAGVLELVTALRARADVPFMLERDGRYPPAAALFDELDAIAVAAGCAPITRDARRRWA